MSIPREDAGSAIALDVFKGVLRHVDRLNSWVRAPNFSRGYCSSRSRVIYHYKKEAIKAAQALGLTKHSLVAIVLMCRDCQGKKRYTDQYGFTHDHCNLCSSTGSVKLRFISTVIEAAGIRWYSPTGWRYPTSHFPSDWEKWPEQSPGDWTPNQPGNELTPDEAAESLIAVETFFPERPRARYVSYDYYAGGEIDDFATYGLHIGETMPGICCLCINAPPLNYGFCCNQGRLHWTAHVCGDCRDLWPEAAVLKRCSLNVPNELLTPHVIVWRDTHPSSPPRN